MSLEALSTIAAFGSFIVITVTAIAALIQLRHLRSSNQLSAMLKLLELEQSPQLEERFHFVRSELAAKMREPEFRASLEAQPVDRTLHPERHVIAWFEHIGAWMKHGLVDEKAYLEIEAVIVDQFWTLLAPTIADIRRTRQPWLLEDFEYLAARAKRWLAEHPRGNYPNDTPHLDVVEPIGVDSKPRSDS